MPATETIGALVTAVTTIGGGAWAGVKGYRRYLDRRERERKAQQLEMGKFVDQRTQKFIDRLESQVRDLQAEIASLRTALAEAEAARMADKEAALDREMIYKACEVERDGLRTQRAEMIRQHSEERQTDQARYADVEAKLASAHQRIVDLEQELARRAR